MIPKEMSITVENIEKAIQEFYLEAATHSEAHQWLTSTQISTEAWHFCWDLMNPMKPPEIQFFGATTLYVKISKFWHELQPDQYVTLRKKLLEHIVIYASGPKTLKIVLTRLCVALASFVIHTICEHWKQSIPDIIASFQQQSLPNLETSQILLALMEILTVLPEEFQSAVLAQSYRGLVRHELTASLVHVLPVLRQVLSHYCSSELHLQTINCLSSWIQFGIPLSDCEDILSFVLDATKDEDLCEAALDCLANIACHQDVHKYASALQRLVYNITELQGVLNKILSEKDYERCYSFYYLFTSVAETHSRILLENVLHPGHLRDTTLRLVNLILQCTATPGQFPTDETCSGLVFNFWYILQDDVISSDPEKSEIYKSYFYPIYSSLLDILIVKCSYPSDEEYCMWNSDDKEQFRCYRQDIGDTLMYCYNLLREPMLQKLFGHLDSVLRKIDSEGGSAWKILEACLFAFESVAESVDLEEAVYLPQFFSRISNIPFTNMKVINTALGTIGAYAEWIHCHPEVLSHVMPLLILGLSNKDIAPASTRALKEISRDCQQNMKPFAEQILTESQRVLNSNILHSNENIRLMCTVGRLLSLLELEDILSYLTNLLMPCLQQLNQLSELQPTPVSQQYLLVLLNMLAMLFANLDIKLMHSEEDSDERILIRDESISSSKIIVKSNDSSSAVSFTPSPTQPVLVVLQQIMPIIHKVALVWVNDAVVIDAVCDVLKKAVSTLLDDCLSLMPSILNLTMLLYQTHPRVSLLDLAKQFLLLFGKDDTQVNLLRSFFSSMVNVTLAVCDKGIAEQTDIVQGFLQMLAQVVKKNPLFLLHPDFHLAALFQCGIVALSLHEAPTVKAAASFLVTFIKQSQDSGDMINVVNECGEALTEQTLRCIGGASPRGIIDHMSDILLVLNKMYFDKLCGWMNIFLLRDNFPSPRLSREQKEHYIRLILKEKSNKYKLKELVKEFSLVCHGLMGTEYASQVMPYL